MQKFYEVLGVIDSYLGGHEWFILLLLGTGLFFTIYLKFPQIRYFKHALRVVRGKYDNPNDEGDTSHFQALSTALSGTVGTGNIAGVALAVHVGGPAAVFWMLVTAFLGMTTKFVEVTLSHKYREKASDGTMAGGPMYYMKNRLNMKWLAVIFAIATIFSSFGTGNLPQVNNIAESIHASFGINNALTGAVLAVLLGLVIIGGIRRIAKVTERLVPFMAVVYIIGAFSVLIYNYNNLLPAIASIFTDVFTGSAATGGFLGATVGWAINRGVNRGLFSNEAGQGSAPIAHASARTKEPVSEGMVAILEPFIDTIVICTITALVLLSSGVWKDKLHNEFHDAEFVILEGVYSEENPDDLEKLNKYLVGDTTLQTFTGEIEISLATVVSDVTIIHSRSIAEEVQIYKKGKRLIKGHVPIKNGKPSSLRNEYKFVGKSLIHSSPLTTEAFKRSHLGNWGQYIVAIGLLLFAFSTAISWSYYGDRAVTFLVGTKYLNLYRLIYIIGFFLASFTDTKIVWAISYVTIALMTIPNLIGILILHKEMRSTVRDYWSRYKNNRLK
ncbi:MAG: amino acid carrier protein [Bacteroidetes bacterium]|jgi:AGCS family alanine or glycine:cation symporter|nr:amino acid carrier protein [Bacteroidota bacterium]